MMEYAQICAGRRAIDNKAMILVKENVDFNSMAYMQILPDWNPK